MTMRSQSILSILPEATAEGVWAWFFSEEQTEPVAITALATLEQALPLGKSLIILLPSTFLTLTTAQLPTRQAAQVLRALPYALEEALAEDIEQLHLSPGAHLGDGRYPVLAIKREKMQEIAETFQNLPVHCLTADVLALPWQAGEVTIFADHDWFWLRHDAYGGCLIPQAQAESWFHAFLPTLGTPEDLTIHYYYQYDVEVPPLSLSEAWQQALVVEPVADRFRFWQQGLQVAEPISLLIGPYKRQPRWQKELQQWRAAAVFLFLGTILGLANLAVDTWRLQQEVQRLENQAIETFRETFPNLQRVVNPRVQMEAELNKLRRSQGVDNNFLQLLSVLAQEKNNEISVLSLNFRQQVLEIDVLLPNVQAAENLRNRLTQQGVTVAIRNVVAEQNQVRARLRLES
jgi:general secretion pathway protein L